MKSTRMLWFGVCTTLVLALCWLGAAKVSAQSGDWEVVRAEYGAHGRGIDVTDRVQRLLWDGRATGRAPVTNETMGGDPARGADKTLHIWAHNWRNEEREFDIREGGWIDVATFRVREVRDYDRRDDRRGDDDDCWCREGRQDRWRGERGLRILRAYYGLGGGGGTANVTEIVRRLARNDSLRVEVNSRSLGGDPAPGHDKVLTVIFRYDGAESAHSEKEGSTLHIP